jgi:septum formation protein
MKIILASKSPRRKIFLEMLGLEFEVIPSQVNERKVKDMIRNPVELATTLAEMKAQDVADRLKPNDGAIVIGADTLVSFEGRVIGKARDKDDAENILAGFRGKEHTQITGICLINTRTGKKLVDHEETRALVRNMSNGEIRDYVDTGEPLEGAGAYTPKAHTILFERIYGSWTNIVGLPMGKFVTLLGDVQRE